MNPTGPHPGWQERTIQLLGQESYDRLAHSNVLVAGMGGVGSMAAEMICRAGVGRMTIIDADTIQPSNVNRQIPATHATLNQEKAVVMGERLREINPGLELTVLNEYIMEERIPEILEESFDYVVDAIDTLTPKIYLIYHTVNRGLKLASSMGSGGKVDPSQIQVADFGESYNCRLAYNLRKKLRKLGVESGFNVVFSTEQVPKEMIIPVEGERNKKSTVGTISYIPVIFGCTLASIVIRELSAAPVNG
ncbi:MAG: tRNA threonylcarbamoyladenosine dehydratase [Bacteroidetes bacterium]|nr:tRNA threonylcarbamoyladenosine dehydratase [Bacteroidota bacterium]